MHIVKMKEAQKHIEQENTFRASNLQGIRLYHHGEYKSYIVMSYATIIFGKKNNGEVFINRLNESFSRSTSRHQSIIKRAFNIK